MWKLVGKRRLRKLADRSAPIAPDEIASARRVLFAVFARYGDSVIAFKSIARFLQLDPQCECLVVTTHQALPYARALIPPRAQFCALNKRRDPLRLLRLVTSLRRHPPEIGLNPWSHGWESDFLISYCRRFHFFRSFDASCGQLNHYEKLRRYLSLPPLAPRAPAELPAHTDRILLSPFSTDEQRSLDDVAVGELVRGLRERYPRAQLTVAVMPSERRRIAGHSVDKLFAFGKSYARSSEFLALLKETDLFVGVDSGPLHLADALRVPAAAVFRVTKPEMVLDDDNTVVVLDAARLANIARADP